MEEMYDVGVKSEYPSEIPREVDEPKVHYPTLCINKPSFDTEISDFDEEVVAVVKLKKCGRTKNEYSDNVEYKVKAIQFAKKEKEEEEEEVSELAGILEDALKRG